MTEKVPWSFELSQASVPRGPGGSLPRSLGLTTGTQFMAVLMSTQSLGFCLRATATGSGSRALRHV